MSASDRGFKTGRKLLLSHRWLLVAPAMLLLWVVGQIDKTHISLIIADRDFLRDLNLGGHNAELGGLMTTFFMGYGIAIFLWGFIVDRVGPKWSAIAGTVCWAAVLYLSSRVGGIQEYLIIRFLLGLAEGNLWPVCNALTNRWFPIREHSRIQAFWVMGSTLGTAAGVPVVTGLMLASGWRGALAALAVLSLLPLVLFAFVSNTPEESRRLSREEREEIEAGRAAGGRAVRLNLRQLPGSRAFWLIVACQVVSATSLYTLIQWIPSYFTLYRGMPFPRMAGWVTIGYLVATGLTLLGGWVADRTMKRALTGAWTCVIFALVVAPAAELLSPRWSAVVLPALISHAAILAALNGALMHTLVRPEAIARGTGIYVGIGNFLSSAGPFVFGLLINYLGGEYWGGFVYLSLLSVVGVLCYGALHRIGARERAAVGAGSLAAEAGPQG